MNTNNAIEKSALSLQQGENLQRMQSKYATAVKIQVPRDLDRVIANINTEAQYAGEDFFYAWGEGKNHIEGPSVGLALSVAREWGNCAIESDVEEKATAYLFKAHFVDLETGFTLSREFRQSKNWTVYGKLDEMRKEDIRFQIGQSKAIRNVVKDAMPRWLINKAIQTAKQAVYNNITKDGIAASTEKAFKALAQFGVSEERILAKIGKPQNKFTADDIIDLRTAYSAIQRGEAYADEIFPKKEEKTVGSHKEAKKPTPKLNSAKSLAPQVPPRSKSKAPLSNIIEAFKKTPIEEKDIIEYLIANGKVKEGTSFNDIETKQEHASIKEDLITNAKAYVNKILNHIQPKEGELFS